MSEVARRCLKCYGRPPLRDTILLPDQAQLPGRKYLDWHSAPSTVAASGIRRSTPVIHSSFRVCGREQTACRLPPCLATRRAVPTSAPRPAESMNVEVLSQVLGQSPKLTASPSGQADPVAALLSGDQDEGTERDTGQQVQCGCGYSHAAIADRMAEY